MFPTAMSLQMIATEKALQELLEDRSKADLTIESRMKWLKRTLRDIGVTTGHNLNTYCPKRMIPMLEMLFEVGVLVDRVSSGDQAPVIGSLVCREVLGVNDGCELIAVRLDENWMPTIFVIPHSPASVPVQNPQSELEQVSGIENEGDIISEP